MYVIILIVEELKKVEKEKSKKIIITLLIIIIMTLVAIVILLATGIINFKKGSNGSVDDVVGYYQFYKKYEEYEDNAYTVYELELSQDGNAKYCVVKANSGSFCGAGTYTANNEKIIFNGKYTKGIAIGQDLSIKFIKEDDKIYEELSKVYPMTKTNRDNLKVLFSNTSNTVNDDNKQNEETNNDNSNIGASKNTRMQLESIENKYLFALYGYTDLSGVDNQSIMKAILINSSFYPSNSFTKEQLDAELKNSVLSKLSIKHEDFWFNGYNTDVAPTYSYDETTGVYKSNPVGKGACRVSPAYKKVLDYSENNDEYVIKYKYVWYYGCEGAQPDIWYGNYMNAKNQQNAIFALDISKYDHGILPTDIIKNEVEKNWQSIEDKLDTYTYTFKFENNHLVLTNFRRTES